MSSTARPRARTRRAEERDARIDWILDVALEVVVGEGLAALTTPALAKRLRYTPAALYRYFDSKDALLLALETRTAERYYARFFAAFEAARARLPRMRPRIHALAELVVLTRIYAGLARAEPSQFKLVSVLVTGDRSWMRGAAARRLEANVLPQIASLVALFSAAETRGALAPGSAPRRLMTLWLALHAILAAAPLAHAHPQLLDVPAIGDELVMSLLRGWGASARNIAVATRAVSSIGQLPV